MTWTDRIWCIPNMRKKWLSGRQSCKSTESRNWSARLQAACWGQSTAGPYPPIREHTILTPVEFVVYNLVSGDPSDITGTVKHLSWYTILKGGQVLLQDTKGAKKIIHHEAGEGASIDRLPEGKHTLMLPIQSVVNNLVRAAFVSGYLHHFFSDPTFFKRSQVCV